MNTAKVLQPTQLFKAVKPLEEKDFINSVILFSYQYQINESYDVVYKYKNSFNKWAVKWVKKMGGFEIDFISGFIYDEILQIQHDGFRFVKEGKKGFWHYNTRKDFSNF